ncbi:hypothetical protein GCM10009682_05750 [Luedemannella flava]|uniref:Uncharacterized protein n=1 Tax=Luedemannella flava TaxID=349316 RepID=A0ABN2LF06_9ACTN
MRPSLTRRRLGGIALSLTLATAVTASLAGLPATATPAASGLPSTSNADAGPTERAASATATTSAVTNTLKGDARAYRFLFPGRARWNPCATIGYRVNPTYASSGAISDTKAAIARIAAATGLRFSYQGTTRVMPGGRNDRYPKGTQLVIAWARPGRDSSMIKARDTGLAGIGGGSSVGAYTSRGAKAPRIVEGYAVLNAGMKLSGGFGSGPRYGWQGTRGQLLMHEIGHTVGLDHPKQKDTWEIMYPTLTRKPAVFGKGDRAGLKALGRSAGCLYDSRR